MYIKLLPFLMTFSQIKKSTAFYGNFLKKFLIKKNLTNNLFTKNNLNVHFLYKTKIFFNLIKSN
jgi:hypothetical protein